MGLLDQLVKSIAKGIGLDAAELASRKAFLELGPNEIETLRNLRPHLAAASPRLLEPFYGHLLAFEDTARFLTDPALLARVQQAQAAYFDSLTSGEYDQAYVEDRIRIGLVHQSLGLAPKYSIGAYAKYLSSLLQEVSAREPAPGMSVDAFGAFMKVVLLDLGIGVDTYVYAKLQTVEKLKRAIEKVMASVPIGTFVLSADLLVLSSNRKVRDIIGRTHEDLRGRPLEEVLPGVHWWDVLAELLGAVGAQRDVVMPYNRAGDVRVLRVVGTAIERTEDDAARMLLTVDDITEHRRALEQLQESEERFRQVTESIHAVFWMTDTTTNQILYISPTCDGIWGRPRDILLASPQAWVDAIHPEDRSRVLEAATTKQVTGAYHEEYRIVRPTGEVRWILDRAFPIRDEHGHVYRITGIAEDITARKQSEEALQQAYAELKEAQGHLLQSEKMASIGQLAAGVAHEINNPIGYVSSNLRTLAEYTEDLVQVIGGYETLLAAVETGSMEAAALEAKRTRELVKRVDMGFLLEDLSTLVQQSSEGLDRVRQIVQNLKTFSHVDRQEQAWVNINQGIESTLAIVWNELKYKADIIKEMGDIPEILGYPQQLNQVFVNLLVNAAQAIKDKGTIWVRTFVQAQSVVAEVEDTGSGIAPEHLKKIFDPFFTTKPVGKGTGLGLSISYGIVHNHGGTIEVESQPGRGTRFRVVLPVGGAKPASSDVQPGVQAA
ncbi:MAG: protoglobin domain-containing protein [Nitrospirota bacterium]